MIIFLLTLILLVLVALVVIFYRKEMSSNVTIMQPVPPEKLVLFDPHGFEAAVKEERRQMAFDKFCMHYNEFYDYFCSKPAGHDTGGYVKGEKRTREHGYAGVFWNH